MRKNKFLGQVNAVIYRKALIYKRSLCSLILTLVVSVFISVIPIILPYLMSFTQSFDLGFNSQNKRDMSFGEIAFDSLVSQEISSKINDFVKFTAENEAGITPKLFKFSSLEELQNFSVHEQRKKGNNLNMVYAYGFTNDTVIKKLADGRIDAILSGIIVANESNSYSAHEFVKFTFRRLLWKLYNNDANADIVISSSHSTMFTDPDAIAGFTIPFTLSISFLIFGTFFVSQIIDDVKTARRPYMVACGLDLRAYWLANFAMDIIFYEFFAILIYVLNICCKITFFKDYYGELLYIMILSGPTMLLLCYCCSFLFSNKAIGSTFYLFMLAIPYIVAIMVDLMVANIAESIPNSYLAAILPVINIYRFCFFYPQQGIKGISRAFENDKVKAYFIMPIADIGIFALILWIVEVIRIHGKLKIAKMSFNLYEDVFRQRKEKQPVTNDAVKMEERVQNSQSNDFAVRISNVSKLFLDTSGSAVCAVNSVSLGVEHGSMFGFLGANGAGKTTLLNMIIGKEAISNGRIEIEGIDVTDSKTKKKQNFESHLTVCPQFDDHLTIELTGRELLTFFAKLYNLENITEKVDRLIELIDFEEHCDKLISQMSGGNQRKVCVLLPFLSDAHIILLDEPTSSLDPVARHKIHNLIKEFRGKKTFMLCTHLLGEVEALCDHISIMINGCIYAVGTPQYLSNRFGTEYKVDVLLESPTVKENVTNFFAQNLPMSYLTIDRPLSRIYSIPSNQISMLELFRKMQSAVEANFGVKYFTCSSSNLEKVFLEIVLLSEQKNEIGENVPNVVNEITSENEEHRPSTGNL